MPSRTAVIAPKQSLPVRGAWIEMTFALGAKRRWKKSLPVRGAWIEMSALPLCNSCSKRSLPVRGAWIEISSSQAFMNFPTVAPRAGSVD